METNKVGTGRLVLSFVVALLIAFGFAVTCKGSTWNDDIPALANQLSDDIPKIETNFEYLHTLLENHYKPALLDTDENIGKDAYYFVQASEADQGVAASADSDTLYSITATIGNTKNAVIVLSHAAASANTTTYTFKTSYTLPSNIALYAEPGVRLDTSLAITDGGSSYTWTQDTGNIYKLDQTISEPASVLYSDAKMTEAADKASISAAGQWAFEGGLLYVWVTGDGDPDALSAGTVEASYSVIFNGPFLSRNRMQYFNSDALDIAFGPKGSDVVFPEWWGATPTADGTGDDEEFIAAVWAIKNSIASSVDYGGPVFSWAPNGKYEWNTTSVWLGNDTAGNQQGVSRIDGNGAYVDCAIEDGICLDLQGVAFGIYRDFEIHGNTTTEPAVLILEAPKTDGLAAGNHHWQNVTVTGEASYGLYNYGSSKNIYTNFTAELDGLYPIVLTSNNLLGVTLGHTVGTAPDTELLRRIIFNGGSAYSTVAAGTSEPSTHGCVYMEGVDRVSFTGFEMTDDANDIPLVFFIGTTTANSRVTFDGCDWGGAFLTGIQLDVSTYTDLKVTKCSYSGATGDFIEGAAGGATVMLDCEIETEAIDLGGAGSDFLGGTIRLVPGNVAGTLTVADYMTGTIYCDANSTLTFETPDNAFPKVFYTDISGITVASYPSVLFYQHGYGHSPENIMNKVGTTPITLTGHMSGQTWETTSAEATYVFNLPATTAAPPGATYRLFNNGTSTMRAEPSGTNQILGCDAGEYVEIDGSGEMIEITKSAVLGVETGTWYVSDYTGSWTCQP